MSAGRKVKPAFSKGKRIKNKIVIMTQYLMRLEKDSENLNSAIEKYENLFFFARPAFTSGIEMSPIVENLDGKKLKFIFQNGLKFSSDKDLIFLPLKDYKFGFKVEYQSENESRMYPYYDNPNNSTMPSVYFSCLRNVIDNILIEISFKGKIILERDISRRGVDYWKIK